VCIRRNNARARSRTSESLYTLSLSLFHRGTVQAEVNTGDHTRAIDLMPARSERNSQSPAISDRGFSSGEFPPALRNPQSPLFNSVPSPGCRTTSPSISGDNIVYCRNGDIKHRPWRDARSARACFIARCARSEVSRGATRLFGKFFYTRMALLRHLCLYCLLNCSDVRNTGAFFLPLADDCAPRSLENLSSRGPFRFVTSRLVPSSSASNSPSY